MTILFVCTGNSCRCQMPEGFARALTADGVEVLSARSREIRDATGRRVREFLQKNGLLAENG